MVTPLYSEFEHILRTIYRARSDNLSGLVKAVNTAVIRSLVELAYNILRGNIPLTKTHVKTLKKYKKELHLLIAKNRSIKKKRITLEDNLPLIKIMLHVVFGISK